MGGFSVKEKIITVIKLGMNSSGSYSRSSFNVKHGPNAAAFTNIHEAGVLEVGDLLKEGKMLIKDDANFVAMIAYEGVGS